MTPAQCRAARALLDLQQNRLAAEAKVSPVTLLSFERGRTRPQRATVEILRQTLERAGVTFIGSDATAGVGVRLAAPEIDAET